VGNFSMLVDVAEAEEGAAERLVESLSGDRRILSVTHRLPVGRPASLGVALTVEAESPESAAQLGLGLAAAALPSSSGITIPGDVVFGIG
jgi:hypothetical protein